MPVQFSWDNPEQTIVRYEFIGKWTWQEMHEVFHQSWGEINQLPYTIDSISDFSATNSIPSSAMTHIRSLAQNRPANTRLMIFVGANTYLTRIVQTFNQLYHTVLKRELKLQFVETLADARSVLAQMQSEGEV